MKKIFILFIFIFTFTLCSCEEKTENVLTVDYDGGTYNNQTSETIVVDGIKKVNDLGKPKKHGYNFIGWADSNKSTRFPIDQNKELNMGMKLVPVYEPKDITIEFKTDFPSNVDIEVNTGCLKQSNKKNGLRYWVESEFTYDENASISLRAEGIEGYNQIVIKSDVLEDDIVVNYRYIPGGITNYGIPISPEILSEKNTFVCYYENRAE
jgi:hypothetical protein